MKLIIAHQFLKSRYKSFFPSSNEGEEDDPITLESSESECNESYSDSNKLDPDYTLGEEDDPIIIESSKSECNESYSGSDILDPFIPSHNSPDDQLPMSIFLASTSATPESDNCSDSDHLHEPTCNRIISSLQNL